GIDEAFSQAHHVEADRFISQRISHLAMETRGFLTVYDRGTNKLKHHSTAQFPHKMRWELADALQLPEKNVQVIAPHVRGSFGMKPLTFPEDVGGAVVARELGRHVKWLRGGREVLVVMQGGVFEFDVQIAFDRDGIIFGVKNDVVVNIGAYPF